MYEGGALPQREAAAAPPAVERSQHLHDLEVLNTLHRIADSSGLNLHERLSAIVKVVAFHLGSDACSIFLEEKRSAGKFILAATHGLNAEAVGRVSLAPGEGVTGWVGREQVSLPIGDTQRDPRFKIVSEMGDEGFRAILAAPIRLEQRLIGVINVQSREVREYGPEQVRLLENIAMHLAGIIRTTQLYEDTKKQLKQLRIINGIGHALVSTLHLGPLLEMVMAKSVELTHTRGGVLRLWDEQRQQLAVRVTTGEPLPDEQLRPLYLGEGIAGMAALKQEQYLVNTEEGEDPSRLLPKGVRHNYLCVPVVYQGRAIGAISVYDKVGENGSAPLTEDDRNLLRSLANQVAVAIRNAQVCDELTDTVEDLKRTRDLRVQAETLEAVGRMAEAVGQELRVPLIPIQGLIRRLLEGNPTEEQRASYLEVLQRETARMEAFLDEVMELGRGERVSLEKRNLDELVREVTDTVAGRCAAGGVTLEVVPGVDKPVYVDPEKFAGALCRILESSLEVLNAGGAIRVSTSPCSYSLERESVDGVCVSVRDSGDGIDDEAMPHLFTPFFPIRSGGRGGLGLAIAYRIARAHGGTLLAHNPPEGGVEFSLFLPETPRRRPLPPRPRP